MIARSRERESSEHEEQDRVAVVYFPEILRQGNEIGAQDERDDHRDAGGQSDACQHQRHPIHELECSQHVRGGNGELQRLEERQRKPEYRIDRCPGVRLDVPPKIEQPAEKEDATRAEAQRALGREPKPVPRFDGTTRSSGHIAHGEVSMDCSLPTENRSLRSGLSRFWAPLSSLQRCWYPARPTSFGPSCSPF